MVRYRTLNMATQGREPRQGDPSRGRSSCGVPIAVAENLRQIRPRLAVAGIVLEGRAVELERDAPFAVFVNALDDYLASLNPRTSLQHPRS